MLRLWCLFLLASQLSASVAVSILVPHIEEDSELVCAATSFVPGDSSLVPLDSEILLDAFSQCTWLHPVAIPAATPEQLALAPPPVTLQSGPEPEFAGTQADSPPSTPPPPTEKNNTSSVVPDGGIKETERPNVASSHDGARLLFSNTYDASVHCSQYLNSSHTREAKKPEAILSGDKFTFMKNNCGDDKFVVIELSQRVKLTSLEIEMIELYSSRARTIDLYSTLTKPVKAPERPWLLGDWVYHATVKAENKKGDHVFNFAAKEFTRYLLLHFTSHFGAESVCTINNVRVFGVTETEDLEAQLEALQQQEASLDAAAATAAFAAAAAEVADLSYQGDIYGSLDTPALTYDTQHSVDASAEMFMHLEGIDPVYGGQADEFIGPPGLPSRAGSVRDVFDGNDSVDVEPPVMQSGGDSASSQNTESTGSVWGSAAQQSELDTHDGESSGSILIEDELGPSAYLEGESTGAQEDKAVPQQGSTDSPANTVGTGESTRKTSVDSNTPPQPASVAEPYGDSDGSEEEPAKGAQGSPPRTDGDRHDGSVPGPSGHNRSHAGESVSENSADNSQGAPSQGTHAPSQAEQDLIEPHPAAVQPTTVHPAPASTASKVDTPSSETQNLLIADGVVTGLYQTAAVGDSNIKTGASSNAAGGTTADSTSASVDTSTPDAPSDAKEGANPASATKYPRSYVPPGSKSESKPPPVADAAPSTKAVPEVPTGAFTQQKPLIDSDHDAASSQGPTESGNAASASPQTPPGQPRAQAQPASGQTNANTTTTGSAGSATPAAGTGEGSPASTPKSGSVYDTIKKELLSLRVETSTLSKSMAATATLANVTALTRRYDATLKRVTAVGTRVHELEQVLSGLQLASAEAARALQRLQTEVSAAIVLSAAAIALSLYVFRSYRFMGEPLPAQVSGHRQGPPSYRPTQRRSNGGPVNFYSRSQFPAEHTQRSVPQSHSTQSLPNAALQYSYINNPGGTNFKSGPSSHSSVHHKTLSRTPSGTAAVPQTGSISPFQYRGATAATAPPAQPQRYVDERQRNSEYHDPVNGSESTSVPRSGAGALFAPHCSGSTETHGDTHAYSAAVWNSDSAFDEAGPSDASTTVPPTLRRSFGSCSIHSIRTTDGFTRQNRSRASSGAPSPAATSPTHESHATAAWHSHPHSVLPPQHEYSSGGNSHIRGSNSSGNGSSTVLRRRVRQVLERASAPTASQVHSYTAHATIKSAAAKSAEGATGCTIGRVSTSTVDTSTSAQEEASGPAPAGTTTRELDSSNLGDSTDMEDLMPAPTFAPLAHSAPSKQATLSNCHQNTHGQEWTASNDSLPLPDSCAHRAAESSCTPDLFPQLSATSTLPELKDSPGMCHDRSHPSSHGASPLNSHRSRGESGRSSPDISMGHSAQHQHTLPVDPSLHSEPSNDTLATAVQKGTEQFHVSDGVSRSMSSGVPPVPDASIKGSSTNSTSAHKVSLWGSTAGYPPLPAHLQPPIPYGSLAYTSHPPSAAVLGSADGTKHVNSSSLHGAVPALERHSPGVGSARRRLLPMQSYGSMNAQLEPPSEGSLMSDAWGGSDSGSHRGSRGRSVHVLRSHPSFSSLPGSETT